jgi:hypothetical protein
MKAIILYTIEDSELHERIYYDGTPTIETPEDIIQVQAGKEALEFWFFNVLKHPQKEAIMAHARRTANQFMRDRGAPPPFDDGPVAMDTVTFRKIGPGHNIIHLRNLPKVKPYSP